jgi:glutaredoxin
LVICIAGLKTGQLQSDFLREYQKRAKSCQRGVAKDCARPAKKEVAKRTGFGILRRMEKPKIIAYLKPHCGWSQGVRAVLRKYDLPYEDRDIINDPAQRQEMIERSGQMLSPCVEINGKMLPDISGEEVEAYMLANNLVQPNSRMPDAPTNQPCAHEMPGPAALNFKR